MKWIWHSDATEKNCYVNFKREFVVSETPDSASIKIAADSEYVLYINGNLVGTGQYDDFPPLYTYDTYEITKYIQNGLNTLGIFAYYQGEESYQYKKGEAGICFELCCGHAKIVSDKNTLSAISKLFKNGEDVHKTTIQYGYGFVCDGRYVGKEEYKESIEKPLPSLQPRPIEKCYFEDRISKVIAQGTFLRQKETNHIGINMMRDYLSSKTAPEIFESDMETIKSDEDIYVIYDLGKNTSGYFTMDIEAEEGTVVDIGYGEHLDDMRVRAAIGDFFDTSRPVRCFANRYICREGKQNFSYYYRRISGRYIELHITGKIKSIKNVKIIGSFYPVKDTFTFNNGDNLLNKIFDVSKYTLKMCMHEHYEDCPWREQALYGSDSRNQMLFGYYAFKEFKFARASLELLAKSICDDGVGTIVAPTDSLEYKIPSFTFIWLLAMREYIEYSGDKTLAKEYFPLLKMMAEKRLSEVSDSLPTLPDPEKYWNFYEWSETNDGFYIPKEEKDVKDGLYCAFFYLGLKSIAEIFALLGYKTEAENILKELKIIKEKINQTFFDEEKGVYASFVRGGRKDAYSEIMQAICLYTGIAEGKEDALSKILVNDDNGLIKLTLSYLVYKYDALLSQGDKYKELVYNEIIEKWGKMLSAGATTFWETEKGADDFDKAGSLCHGWSAVPLYVFGKYFAD